MESAPKVCLYLLSTNYCAFSFSSLSLCHRSTFMISTLLSPFFLFLLHTISSLLMKTCHFVVFLPISAPTLSSFSRLPHLTPTPTCLLQVVKWILLSQPHQGKSRKRKRIEPKVNYKEVGDTLVYYDFCLHCFSFFSKVFKMSLYFGNFFVSIYLGFCSLKVVVSVFVCLTTQLSPILFMCCLCEGRLPCTCSCLCLCCVLHPHI